MEKAPLEVEVKVTFEQSGRNLVLYFSGLNDPFFGGSRKDLLFASGADRAYIKPDTVYRKTSDEAFMDVGGVIRKLVYKRSSHK